MLPDDRRARSAMGNHGGAPSTGAHRAVGSAAARRRSWWLPALGGVVLLGVGIAVGLLAAPRAPSTTPAAAAAVAPTTAGVRTPSHPTLLGDVVRVDSGDEVVVRLADTGEEATVAILGITAPRSAGPQRTTGECGAADALRFADQRLSGQTVTLVPDPTVPETDAAGRRLAYVVLPSQQNFTDAALVAGVVGADTSRRLWYAPVFAREQTESAAAKRGVWGAPCRATPGEPMPVGS